MGAFDYSSPLPENRQETNHDLPHVQIYCDGAASPNPGAAGIGVVLLFGSARKELSEPIGRASNNAAEIQAAIRGLMALTKTCRVTLHSDSQYLVETMKGNFNRRSNEDLWRDLDFACLRHEIEWVWVPGHDGEPNNERAHQLANAAIRKNGRQP